MADQHGARFADGRFPVPYGWFQIGIPSDLAVGEVKPLQVFDRHVALWRDEEGEAHLSDAFCPHLGAHVGHGGEVRGCEVVCPFHGWRFDAEGHNTHIPYSKRTNRKARLGSYPVIERNGLVMAWYHPTGAAPMWEIPVVPEFSDLDTYTEPEHREFNVGAPWQEMAENGVDSAHFGFVHGQEIVPELDSYELDGPRAYMSSTQRWPTADGVVDGFVETHTYGPGFSIVRMIGIVDTVSLGCNTPIAPDRCHLRMSFVTKRLDDPAVTDLVSNAFIDVLTQQIGEDARVWEHKKYVPRPALADGDGPFAEFRRWAAQFYAEADASG
jgi:3-ketosteroid 9alpha-monooxygenase subunit A